MVNAELNVDDENFLHALHMLGCDDKNYVSLRSVKTALSGEYDVEQYLTRLTKAGYLSCRDDKPGKSYAMTKASVEEVSGIADIPLDESIHYDAEEGE